MRAWVSQIITFILSTGMFAKFHFLQVKNVLNAGL